MIPEHLREKTVPRGWIGEAPFIGDGNQWKRLLKRTGEQACAR
jgi:hypothetical protein